MKVNGLLGESKKYQQSSGWALTSASIQGTNANQEKRSRDRKH